MGLLVKLRCKFLNSRPKSNPMNITLEQLMQVFTPLLLALHEKRVLDIAEIPHFYEDALERRRTLGATEVDLDFQRQLVDGMSRLALAVKDSEKNRLL